jgi:hypothetical protein
MGMVKLKIQIIDKKGIYFGEYYFHNNEIVDVISLKHDGECQVLEVFSTMKECNFRIYETEFDSIEFLN